MIAVERDRFDIPCYIARIVDRDLLQCHLIQVSCDFGLASIRAVGGVVKLDGIYARAIRYRTLVYRRKRKRN